MPALPELWTHQPRSVLAFRPGSRVADIDTHAAPGFSGDKSDAPELQAERNAVFASLQEQLYACGKAGGDHRSVLLVLQGMDTAGKGGIVEHVVGAGNPMGIRYTSRLAARLERPEKYWKYNPGDLDERALWPSYQRAYQAVLDRTSTEYAPWHVVPCDRKWYARLAVTELLIEALHALNLTWPPADFDVEAEKKRLASA